MNSLKGKKILFFCPKYFGYEEKIANKLEDLGAKVTYFDERPGNDFYTKAAIRLNKKIVKKSIEKYYTDLIESSRKIQFDYVFVVEAEAMTNGNIKDLKKAQPRAKFILYTWDSLKNNKYTEGLLPLFDEVFSFDKKDAEAYENVKFRPLFYSDIYEKISKEQKKIKYDCSFVGTVHSDRYSFINKIEKQLKALYLNTSLFYFYFPSKAQYWFKKLRDQAFKKTPITAFKFKPLSPEETAGVVATSNVVIDVQHPHQSGLTMRTIEVLGAHRKLITTNTDIVNYDFYNADNICVIDRENPSLPVDFFEKPTCPVNEEILERYSLTGWVNEIFGLAS